MKESKIVGGNSVCSAVARVMPEAVGAVLVETGPGRITVRSERTGGVRVYRVYRDGRWEMDHSAVRS